HEPDVERAVRQLQRQPRHRDALHPRPDGRDDLAGQEQPVVPMPKGAERAGGRRSRPRGVGFLHAIYEHAENSRDGGHRSTGRARLGRRPGGRRARAEVVDEPRQGREARRRAAARRHPVPLPPRPPRWHQGDARRRAEDLQEAEAVLGHVHPRSAQGVVVVHVHREQGSHPRRLRDGLRARRPAAFRGRPAVQAVRRGHPPEHGPPQEVRRVRQGPEAEVLAVLAYVFSHRPAPGADVASYEEVLRAFHRALAEMRPPGFVRSMTYRLGPAYADWYLVENSAALDPLNEAAVTGARQASHDAAARLATDGVGKLLNLAAGEFDPDALVETRFAKPRGMGYGALYGALERWTHEPGTSLWRRMMVLGPPPEFTLVSSRPVELPAELNPETIFRTAV